MILSVMLAIAMVQPETSQRAAPCTIAAARRLDIWVGEWDMDPPGSGLRVSRGRSSVRRRGCTLEERITEPEVKLPRHGCCFHCPPQPPLPPLRGLLRINRVAVSGDKLMEGYVRYEGRPPRLLTGGWTDGALELRGEWYGWVFVHTIAPQTDGTLRVTISETYPANPELKSALPFEEWVYRRILPGKGARASRVAAPASASKASQ